MTEPRYTATTLRAALDKQERSIAWLARKCGVTYSLMNYIVNGQRTASHEVASDIVKVVGGSFSELFESTSADESVTDAECVA